MKKEDIVKSGFSMPYHRPSYPKGPYRFIDREFMVITYETELDLLKQVVPEPLEVTSPYVKYEFIRMPDSTGFGNYTESGQVIPVSYLGEEGAYTHSMFLDDHSPIAGGREIWGFPKKLATPEMEVIHDTFVGKLYYGEECVAKATMGYKYEEINQDDAYKAVTTPGFLLKIIPHVDGSMRVCELVRYQCEDVVVKGAWSGPGSLELFAHALAPVSELPVKRVVSATHIMTDLTLPYGKVVFDYLN